MFFREVVSLKESASISILHRDGKILPRKTKLTVTYWSQSLSDQSSGSHITGRSFSDFFFTFLTLKTQDFSYVFFIQNSEEIVRVTIAVSKFTSRGMKVHGYEVVRLTPDYVRYIFVKVVVAFPHCCFSWPNFTMIVPNFTVRMLNIN